MASIAITCRTPEAVQFLSAPVDIQEQHAIRVTASTLEYSVDAALYALVDASCVNIYETSTHNLKQCIPCEGIQAISFSPKATYLTIFQRPMKSSEGVTGPNLRVWSMSTGKEVLALHQKTMTRDHWPSLQFTSDESLAIHMVTNTLHAYVPGMFDKGPQIKFPVKGVAAFAVSPAVEAGKRPVVAVYVPEAKGSPGHVALYMLAEVPSGQMPSPIARRSFYRANSARFLWAPTGSAVLVITAADVDATNQSYYGEQKLFYFAADGSNDAAVPLAKEGPIHDVQWNPRGDCFVAVAGFMPAKTTLFTAACVPKYDLGSGPYALARWNPFGRFLVLAGFGNLPGDLAFFDKKADGKCKPMGVPTRAENGVTLQWSPCGRYVLAATIAPRLRVDNGFQIFKYDGTLVAKQARDVLYEAIWAPTPAGSFQDRPQTPRAAGAAATGSPATDAGPAALPQQPAKAAGYVPPHLRNNPRAVAAAKASFSLAGDPKDKGGVISAGRRTAAAPAVDNLPPGAAPPPSKAASKNAKRRGKKKTGENGSNDASSGIAGLTI